MDTISILEDLTNSTSVYELETKLKQLEPLEEFVIRRLYGISYDKSLNLGEIGSIFNLTRERIRQIEFKTLKQLRKNKRLRELELGKD